MSLYEDITFSKGLSIQPMSSFFLMHTNCMITLLSLIKKNVAWYPAADRLERESLLNKRPTGKCNVDSESVKGTYCRDYGNDTQQQGHAQLVANNFHGQFFMCE